jgi:hypothetical protein
MRALILLLLVAASIYAAPAHAVYQVCVVGDTVTCYSANVVTGWRFCMDAPPSAGGVLTATDRPGRFVAFDSNTECGPLGCIVTSGRFQRRELAQNDAGASFATGIILADEFFDDFERLDQFSTSACTFSRFLVGPPPPPDQ